MRTCTEPICMRARCTNLGDTRKAPRGGGMAHTAFLLTRKEPGDNENDDSICLLCGALRKKRGPKPLALSAESSASAAAGSTRSAFAVLYGPLCCGRASRSFSLSSVRTVRTVYWRIFSNHSALPLVLGLEQCCGFLFLQEGMEVTSSEAARQGRREATATLCDRTNTLPVPTPASKTPACATWSRFSSAMH